MSLSIASGFPADTSSEAEGVLTSQKSSELGVLCSRSSVEITVENIGWISLHPSVAEAFAAALIAAAREARRMAR